MKLNSKALRLSKSIPKEYQIFKKNAIYIVLDNVLDTYNIGAIFRLADACAIQKILLCEGSETPPNHRIKKSSINTTEWVTWEYYEKTTQAIQDLRLKIPDVQIIAVEQAKNSILYDKVNYSFPVALVVGHETTGVSEDVLKLCDKIVELPMWGVNVSLNVMVSLGIVLYKVMEKYSSK